MKIIRRRIQLIVVPIFIGILGFMIIPVNTDASEKAYGDSCTITFDANGGSLPAPDVKNVNVGGACGTLSMSTYHGHVFCGWYTKPEGGVQVTTSNTVIRDYVLYARWTNTDSASNPGYTEDIQVSFDGNGGSSVIGSKAVASMSTYGVLPTVTKTGYTFEGWSWHRTEKIKSKVEESTIVTIPVDHTLYAGWKANTYTVLYDGNGATSGSVAEQNFTYDESQKLAKNEYERTGYTFLGWALSSDATSPSYQNEQSVKNFTTAANGKIILYAVWEKSATTETDEPYKPTTEDVSEKTSEDTSGTDEPYKATTEDNTSDESYKGDSTTTDSSEVAQTNDEAKTGTLLVILGIAASGILFTLKKRHI